MKVYFMKYAYIYYIHKFDMCARGMVSCCISFYICLSAEAVDWQGFCFVTVLLNHAPLKMAPVLVLFIFKILSVDWYIDRPL